MDSGKTSEHFEIIEYQYGRELVLETPGTHSMDTAIEILAYIESALGANVKDTGWKQGFGLEIAIGVPIRLVSCEAELITDGSGIWITRKSGSKQAFDELCAAIRNMDERPDSG